ncbi:MAG TPA: hypothetical protein VI942_03535 [Thermoanaerobaculia bacterium]|nr:hypothetical protein [Thermoanaerobaculia bacterium]
MTVQDLNSLHRHYVDLAGRFKAAWTFHQFLQGLQKLFVEVAIPQYPTELTEIHGTLKLVSESLTGNDPSGGIALLERAARQLDQTVAVLSAADVRVTPPLLRQFFERVKSYDDQILAQMVRFYLGLAAEEGLAGDRLDKVDFLLTKLGEETDPVSGAAVLRDRTRLRSIFDGFWASLEELTAEPDWIEERKQEIAAFRREVLATQDLAAFTRNQLVPRYREAKRLLGRYLFHPDLLQAVVETNLAIKNKVRQNFKIEEQRILDESKRILAAGASLAPSMTTPDLSQLQRAYAEVERKQRADNLKLEDLAFLRREVEELRPRLLERRPEDASASDLDGDDSAPVTKESLLGPYLKELQSALEGTDDRTPPKEAALSRDLFHLRMEAREIQAYRRLYVAAAGDPEIEQFILEAAALRHRVAAEATEISEILDETQVTRDSPIFERARRTTQLAEEYVQRFGKLVDDSIKGGSFGEAQQFQLLRMRLIRDYSGLWLLVSRPTS